MKTHTLFQLVVASAALFALARPAGATTIVPVSDHDLALSAISRTIEINLLERIGEPLPKPFEPRDGVLP